MIVERDVVYDWDSHGETFNVRATMSILATVDEGSREIKELISVRCKRVEFWNRLKKFYDTDHMHSPTLVERMQEQFMREFDISAGFKQAVNEGWKDK